MLKIFLPGGPPMSLEKITEKVNKFREERNWNHEHREKDLAISISIEAAELLEDFQWVSSDEGIAENLENIKEELADVMIYSLMLASNLNLDVEEIIEEKLLKNAIKYPIEK